MHARISQHFLAITSPALVTGTRLMLFAFRRHPISKDSSDIPNVIVNLWQDLENKLVFHLPYTLSPGVCHSPHPTSFPPLTQPSLVQFAQMLHCWLPSLTGAEPSFAGQLGKESQLNARQQLPADSWHPN